MQNPSRFRSAEGSPAFALVATLSLLVLLLLITIGLLSLSTIEVRSAGQGAAEAEARANAKLALMLAIGQLQKTLGPDDRISARAETLAGDERIEAPAPTGLPKAWWVGASTSDPTGSLDPSGGNAAENSIVWLVSGLAPQATPAEQLASGQPFRDAVAMYGDNTIDTETLTAGQPIEAGKVTIVGQGGRRPGGLAYFIDDNGMKAQLAASNPEVSNDRDKPYGRGMLPGTYDLSILENMDNLAGRTPEEYNRLLSVNDLPFLGGDRLIARDKRLGYTTSSRGVLSDVKEGGLKKDLTIAFEDDKVFTAVFGNKSNGFAEKYIVMEPEKFQESSDLKKHGYIHWEMLKDFYNIKQHIGKKNGMDYLDSIMITKEGLFNRDDNPFKLGALGPHEIGKNSSTSSFHQDMPYGDYKPIPPDTKRDGSPSKTEYYKHSPLIPVLMRMQQNAWLSKTGSGNNQRLRTNVQLWHAQYNPYNIGLNVLGDGVVHGPRIMHYPQVFISHTGVTVRETAGATPKTLQNVSGFSGKRQTHVPHEVLLGPGRTHVYAFKNYGTVGRDNDGLNYEDQVKDLTLESIYREYGLVSANSGTFTVDFVLERPSMMHGANSNSGNASHEVAQTMWAPFAWEARNGRPSKRITETNVGSSELNENTMASFSFNLRTSVEPGSSGGPAIRPLVDANIRALMCNTKWDSPLGVPLLAAYSAENEGVVDEQIMQMDTQDAPKGYAYWGAGRDPVDGYDRVILFDVPREDLVSLGQLQHASIGRFSYEPTYIVGNSYANLRIPLDEWQASVSDTFSTAARGLTNWRIPGKFNLYDASYLVNEVLWDSYIFTTIPQVADNRDTNSEPKPTKEHYESLRKGEALLANPRFLPYEPPGSKFDLDTLTKTTSGSGKSGAFYHNAGHLMVDGAFNVNSTSVDAWEAFLSGTHNLPYQKMNKNGIVTGFKTDAEGVRFPRVQANFGGPMETDALDENFWTGFRTLSDYEIRELAEAIVAEIRERGPFLTLGEFVNRKLDDSDLGKRGALQAALDKTVNSGLDPNFSDAASHPDVPADSLQGSGFPGQLLQGDILQALSPFMTVRSDTFTIRAYGESRAPGADGKVLARAWCEATVQRYPDPVPGASSSSNPLAELIEPSSVYGRTFRMTSFRWLSPNEI